MGRLASTTCRRFVGCAGERWWPALRRRCAGC